jgi:parallel beta-helix repeat protein
MKQGIVAVAILVALLIGLAWLGSDPAHAASYVVDASADDQWAHDATPGDYVCADTFGDCTLRAALEEANAQGGPHTITFSETMIIYIDVNEGALPSLNEQIKLDASGVWDYGGNAPGVMIHGGSGSFAGLMPNAIGCEIYGLYITAFNGNGVYVSSSSNTIGGTGPGQRNVISGNSVGMTISGGIAQNNIVRNNYVGLTALGTTTNPNGTGMLLTGGASNNIIGGSAVGQGNFIAGNTTNGIVIESSGTQGNLLSGNGIGLGADLATTLPNGHCGVRIQNGPNNTIIGGANGSGNFIVGNGSSGIYIGSAGSGTQVSWNVIAGNTLDGISIYDTSDCQIGENIITNNTLAGVRVSGATAARNLIWPNSITGNGSKGISVQDGGNADIARPTINSASQSGASGTACASCQVALYSDADDEGQVYHDIVWADGNGDWSYVGGPLTGPNLTATAIDVNGNTSEFSASVVVSGGGPYRVYVPLLNKHR